MISSINELMNRLSMTTTMPDPSQRKDFILTYAYEGVRQIGARCGYLTHDEEYEVGTDRLRVPSNSYRLEDIELCGGGCLRHNSSGVARKKYSSSCGCSKSACECVTWQCQGRYIQFSKDVEKVRLVTLAYPVDEEGFLLIDDSLIDALEAFLRLKHLDIRFDEGKVNLSVYHTRQIQWYSKKRAAFAEDSVPGEAEMREISRIVNSKLPLTYAYPNSDSHYYFY